MGFPEDDAKIAITRCGMLSIKAAANVFLVMLILEFPACGQDASISVLVDSIYASETARDDYYGNFPNQNSFGRRKKRRFMEGNKKQRKRFEGESQGSRGPMDGSHAEPMPLPNPMVGFNLPNERFRSVNRWLPSQAHGPPYFYYENVALAPKGVWTTISRFLKRGYIHNLPIENRSAPLPLPPKTITEAFPRTKKWWPSWDPRKQLNCLQIASKLVFLA
ncbi:hypothetical protein ACP70R_033688 [Stipagrostis hirtigluma subsp. patula]